MYPPDDYLNGDTFKHTETSDDGYVERGKRKGKFVHDVTKLADDLKIIDYQNMRKTRVRTTYYDIAEDIL